jgi:hypothetical protein
MHKALDVKIIMFDDRITKFHCGKFILSRK